MICTRCANAADQGLPPTAHCNATGGPGARCDCQHKPARRTSKGDE